MDNFVCWKESEWDQGSDVLDLFLIKVKKKKWHQRLYKNIWMYQHKIGYLPIMKTVIISYLKSIHSDLNGFELMFTWRLSSCVLISQTSGKRRLSAWNPLCLQQLFKFSLCSLHQMLSITHIPYANHLKWEDVLNRDAHSFLVATTQICTGGHNKFLKLTKETNVEIVQLTNSAGAPVSHIFMSSRHIQMII